MKVSTAHAHQNSQQGLGSRTAWAGSYIKFKTSSLFRAEYVGDDQSQSMNFAKKHVACKCGVLVIDLARSSRSGSCQYKRSKPKYVAHESTVLAL